MTIPQTYSFTRYLLAKRSVDDRALNQSVWQWLIDWLAAEAGITAPLQILELGSGAGAMIERLLRSEGLHHANYTAIDADVDTIAQSTRDIPKWAAEHRLELKDEVLGHHLQGPTKDLMMRFEAIDLFDFIAREQGRKSWDLLISHALLDLLDVPTVLPLLFSVLRPGGHFYFPITFDGASIFEPPIDREYDEQIEALYHSTMDNRMVRGKLSGDSRSGRHMFAHLRANGAEVLSAGSSDWVVFAGPGGYPADEAYFLHYIINTVKMALITHPELDAERFTQWINKRHAQVEDQTLVYIAHQIDIIGRLSNS